MAWRPAVTSVDLEIILHPVALITLELKFRCEVQWAALNFLENYEGQIQIDLPQILRRNYLQRDCRECENTVGPAVNYDRFAELDLDRCGIIYVSDQLTTCIAILKCNARTCGRLYCLFVPQQDARLQPQILNGANDLPRNFIVKLPRLRFDENYTDIVFRFNRSYRGCRFTGNSS